MRGPTVDVRPGMRPSFTDERGRVFYLDTPEGMRAAARCGVHVVDTSGWKPLSRTPKQDHVADPLIVDPRPVRPLNDAERAFMRMLVRRGGYIAVAGFESWRARDRWLYVDVLGVGSSSQQAERHGMPVGPITDYSTFRMVGAQLALRVADPWGNQATEKEDPDAT